MAGLVKHSRSVELSEDGEEVSHLRRAASEEDPAAGVGGEQGARRESAEKLCEQFCLLGRHLHQHLYGDGHHADVS